MSESSFDTSTHDWPDEPSEIYADEPSNISPDKPCDNSTDDASTTESTDDLSLREMLENDLSKSLRHTNITFRDYNVTNFDIEINTRHFESDKYAYKIGIGDRAYMSNRIFITMKDHPAIRDLRVPAPSTSEYVNHILTINGRSWGVLFLGVSDNTSWDYLVGIEGENTISVTNDAFHFIKSVILEISKIDENKELFASELLSKTFFDLNKGRGMILVNIKQRLEAHFRGNENITIDNLDGEKNFILSLRLNIASDFHIYLLDHSEDLGFIMTGIDPHPVIKNLITPVTPTSTYVDHRLTVSDKYWDIKLWEKTYFAMVRDSESIDIVETTFLLISSVILEMEPLCKEPVKLRKLLETVLNEKTNEGKDEYTVMFSSDHETKFTIFLQLNTGDLFGIDIDDNSYDDGFIMVYMDAHPSIRSLLTPQTPASRFIDHKLTVDSESWSVKLSNFHCIAKVEEDDIKHTIEEAFRLVMYTIEEMKRRDAEYKEDPQS